VYIVINGGGKVGSFLAKTLSEKGYNVALIERQEIICRTIAAELPQVLVIHGDGCDVRFQEDAGCAHADVFASVTGDDDDNLVACQVAKARFNVARTVARVNNPKNEPIFHEMGIEAISSTTIISHLIEEEATIGDIITLYTLKQGKIALVEVDLPAEYCKVCDKKITDLRLPRDCVIVSLIRDDEIVIPTGDTELQSGDTVIALTSIEKEKELKEILT